jgi:hypothetical protein
MHDTHEVTGSNPVSPNGTRHGVEIDAAAACVPMIQMVFMTQATSTFRVPIPIMRG